MIKVQRVPLPAPLLEHHPTDELDIDFLYVQEGALYLLLKTQTVEPFSLICNTIYVRIVMFFNRAIHSLFVSNIPHNAQQRLCLYTICSS